MIDSLSTASPISNARKRFPGLLFVLSVLIAALAAGASAQRAPSPKSVLGFQPTDERTRQFLRLVL